MESVRPGRASLRFAERPRRPFPHIPRTLLFWDWFRFRTFRVTFGQEPWTRLPIVLSPLL